LEFIGRRTVLYDLAVVAANGRTGIFLSE
jgi:hypothetical protein